MISPDKYALKGKVAGIISNVNIVFNWFTFAKISHLIFENILSESDEITIENCLYFPCSK